MQGGTIKSIIIFILLAIFAFIAGSFVTDGLSEALIPTVMIVGAFGLIALGKNSWWLLFLAPPVFQLIPIPALQSFPVAYFCCGMVLAYWILMSLMGHVRLTWQGVKWLDIATLVVCVYFLSTWVRHPVTIKAFTSYTDEGEKVIGGADYIMCIGAILFYVSVSAIPMKLESVTKVLKYAFWLTLCVSALLAIKNLSDVNGVVSSAGALNGEDASLWEQEGKVRELKYIEFGQSLFKYLFAKYSFSMLMLSPFRLMLLMFSLLCILISGFRSELMYCGVFVLFVNYYRRQLVVCLLLMLGLWGGVILLNQAGFTNHLPFSVQRVLSAVPGVKVNSVAAGYAEHSLEWRYKKWDQVLNPYQGLVDDYVWGDGYGQLASDINRQHYLDSMGRRQMGGYYDNHVQPERGGLHSGWVTAIYHTGYVGLAILTIWLLVFLIALFKTCYAIQYVPNREFLYIVFFGLIKEVLNVYVVTATWGSIFVGGFYSATIIKLVYALARDEGMMKPMFQRKSYVPLMVEANESQSKLRVLQ